MEHEEKEKRSLGGYRTEWPSQPRGLLRVVRKAANRGFTPEEIAKIKNMWGDDIFSPKRKAKPAREDEQP